MRKFFTISLLVLSFHSFLSAQDQAVKLDLNTNFNYRTIEGLDGGNFLDISMKPTLRIAQILGTQFFLNVPYNLSTNKIRTMDTKIGNAFKFAYLGNKDAYISAGSLENFSLGYSNLVLNNYNNQLDESHKRVGAYAGLSYEGFSFTAMANDVSKPEVFGGSLVLNIPILTDFKVNLTGGMDSNPDNNSATSNTISAYGIDLYTNLAIDETNYFYMVAGAAQIQKHGNGQTASVGARFGTDDAYVNLEGSMLRLGSGFEWGFFDTYYERDRKLGFNKADSLFARNPKASGGTNFSAFLGYAPPDANSFSLQAGGFYFTNYAGVDLNEFAAMVKLYVPRSIMGEEGELLTANVILKTKAFENLSGLINRLKKPDNKTIITLDMPVTLLNNIMGMGRLAFVVNYNWNFVFESSTNTFLPQKSLIYGFRLISDFATN